MFACAYRAEIIHSVLDSPPGYTALGPADLGAVYPGALLAHRALFGPICTRLNALIMIIDVIYIAPNP